MAANDETVRVAVIQASPVFLDRDASVEKAVGLIRDAGRRGATLAAFGEGWLPGYPIHASAAATSELWWELAAHYLDQAVDLSGPVIDALSTAAFEADVEVVIGVAERDPVTRGSVYSTQVFIGRDGATVNRHRKLRPALHERLVWADGDAVGLQVHDRGYANVSALCGSEHQMVLPTYALAEQGTQIHVASWPGGEAAAPPAPVALWPRQLLLSRAFAAQAGAYVLCAAGRLAPEDVPETYREFLPQHLSGDSVIIDPRGEVVAGPASGETILVADCSMALVRAAKVAFDCAGHAARRDQLSFRNKAFGEPEEDEPPPDDEGQGFDQGSFDQRDFDQGQPPEGAGPPPRR